jgi:hypothetical protein
MPEALLTAEHVSNSEYDSLRFSDQKEKKNEQNSKEHACGS